MVIGQECGIKTERIDYPMAALKRWSLFNENLRLLPRWSQTLDTVQKKGFLSFCPALVNVTVRLD